MASSPPFGSASSAGDNPKKRSGFLATARMNKGSYVQFFAMTGILLLSMRSLSQKYRLRDLQEDTSALRRENQALTDRMNNIKRDLLREASLDSSGLLASQLRRLFGEEN
ncbi:hypothetical protein Tsubulata_041240 [Turnera subulata]|uniref:Uncharacterized protein n=1 Tax=Turnera subulata TaxID=218843 RepID=A0A9Q0FFF5_9ROSI|nr:hypothetical protein Tsubulata_041240 [Turnera subulata]